MPKNTPELQEETPKTEEKPAVSMDDLTADEDFPAIDQEAVEAIEADLKSTQKNPPNAPEVEKFNPEIHRTDAQGNPVLTKTGKFRKKTGYKLLKPEAVNTQNPQSPAKLTSRGAARIASGTIEKISMVLISDEFQLTPQEKEENIAAWENCIDYYGGCNLSPPWELAANQIGILLTRMDKPKTQNRLFAGWLWLKSKFWRKNKHGALSGSRNDGGGKNDMGEKESAQPSESGQTVPDTRPV